MRSRRNPKRIKIKRRKRIRRPRRRKKRKKRRTLAMRMAPVKRSRRWR
jgi:hypothetical protein